MVANKVTANYINAQGITATSIKVLDDHNNTLFEAGGTPDTDEDGNIILDEKGRPTIKDGVVTVAGWKANATSIRSTATNDNVVLRSRNTELETEGQAIKAKYVEFDAEHPQAFAIDLSQTNAKVDKIDLAKLKIEIQGEDISSGVLLSIPRETTSKDPNYSSTSDSTLDFRLTADTSSSIQVQYNYANEPLPPGIFHPIYPPITTIPPTVPPTTGGGGSGNTPLPTKALLKSNDSADQNGSAEAQSSSSDKTTYPKVQVKLSVDNPLRLTGEQTSDGFMLTGAKSDSYIISTNDYRNRYSHNSIMYIGSINGSDDDGGKLVGKITSYKIWYDSNLLIDLRPMCKVKTIDGKASYQGYLHDAQNNTDYLLGSAGEIKTEPETEFVSIATGVKLNDIKNLTEENLTEALKTAKFAVTNEGKLYANEATINGAVTAGSGKIGNLDVSKSGLYLANAGGRSSFGLENTDCQYIKYATNASTENIDNLKKTSIVAKITVTRNISLLSLFLGCSEAAKTGSILPLPTITITRDKSYCMVTIPTSKKADFKLPYGTQNAFVINSTDTNRSGYQEDINNCSQATLRNLTAGDEFYIIFAFRKAAIGGPVVDSEPWPPNGWFFVPKSLVDDGSIIINTRIAETLTEGDSTKPTYNEKNRMEYLGSPLAKSDSLYLYTKKDDSNNIFPAYFRLCDGNAGKLPIASLKLGANFSANSIGDFSAEYGKIGPWTITGDKFKYSYFGKATDVFGDKIEQ